MTVLIDPPAWPAHGTVFSHLVSDASLIELRAFARGAGVPDRAFDLDHYDVPVSRYDALIASGAVPVEGSELARRLTASGLRIPGGERAGSKRGPLLARWAGLSPTTTARAGTPDRQSDERSAVHSADLSPEDRSRRTDGWRADGWRAVGEELDGRWREPHRTYHTAFHLASALDALDLLLADAAAAGSPVSDGTAWRARVALWFHDAVHDGATPADEEASAALVHDLLGPFATAEDPGSAARVSPPAGAPPRERADAAARPGAAESLPRPGDVDEIARLVMVTANHAPDPDDLAGCLVSDADLAILGTAPATYARYVHQVRAEYIHVPEDLFRQGRAQVLEALLGDGDLFRTSWGRARWQVAATSNLDAELKTLSR